MVDTVTEKNPQRTNRWTTIPNFFCVIRLFGSPLLLLLAINEMPRAFLALFIFFAITDWIDGKLAIWLDQQSTLGARLDSWADATLYSFMLLGGLWLKWPEMTREIWWIVPAIASYAATTIAGFWKYGRWPSYHTRAAKTSWLFAMVGAICLIADLAIWPFRIAAVVVTLTNIEAILITLVLDQWQTNVSSLSQALRIKKET